MAVLYIVNNSVYKYINPYKGGTGWGQYIYGSTCPFCRCFETVLLKLTYNITLVDKSTQHNNSEQTLCNLRVNDIVSTLLHCTHIIYTRADKEVYYYNACCVVCASSAIISPYVLSLWLKKKKKWSKYKTNFFHSGLESILWNDRPIFFLFAGTIALRSCCLPPSLWSYIQWCCSGSRWRKQNVYPGHKNETMSNLV